MVENVVVTLMMAAALTVPSPLDSMVGFDGLEGAEIEKVIIEQLTNQELVIEEAASEEVENKEAADKENAYRETVNLAIYLPDIDNSFKTWMDYTAITDKSSLQWKLQKKAYTDENGLRKVDDCYCVAVASTFSDGIGSKLKITFDTGNEISAIIGDHKSDRHTDDTNTYMPMKNGSINVIEFIIEYDKLAETAKLMGDISYIPNGQFKGQIVSIEKID